MPTLRQEEGKVNSVSLYLLQISIDDTLFGNLQGWPPPIFFVLGIHTLSGVPPVKWRVEVNSTSLSEGNNKISLPQYLVSRKLVVWIKRLASYIAKKKKTIPLLTKANIWVKPNLILNLNQLISDQNQKKNYVRFHQLNSWSWFNSLYNVARTRFHFKPI